MVQHKNEEYFCGKVINGDIEHINPKQWFNHKKVIVMFKEDLEEIDLKKIHFDYNNLLINPYIVSDWGWKSGYFYTIGNQPLTEEEKALDYGFYSLLENEFYMIK